MVLIFNILILPIEMANYELDTKEEYTQLIQACYDGDVYQVEDLLKKGASVEEKDGSGNMAIDYALEIDIEVEGGDLRTKLVCTVVDYMDDLKTRNEHNDRLLQREISKWVIEYVEEIVDSRSKKRHRWGGHYEKFRLREDSYDLAQDLIYEDVEDGSDVFYGLSPLLYACLTGNTELILRLCCQKGSFFSPDFENKKTFEYLAQYQEEMEKLAIDCLTTDVKPCKV